MAYLRHCHSRQHWGAHDHHGRDRDLHHGRQNAEHCRQDHERPYLAAPAQEEDHQAQAGPVDCNGNRLHSHSFLGGPVEEVHLYNGLPYPREDRAVDTGHLKERLEVEET